MKITGIFTVLGLAFSTQLPAAQVSLGQVWVAAGLGSNADFQQVLAYNLTGPSAIDCTTATTFALVCDGLNITNWSATVDYIDHTQAGDPTLQVTNSGGTIAPANDPTTDPQAALPYTVLNSCPPCDTIVTRVQLTLTLDRSSFTIYDPGSASTSTFSAQTPFTFTWDLTSDPNAAAYESGNAPIVLTDIIVPANPGNGGGGGPTVPEPATLWMVAGVTLAAGLRRFVMR